MRLCRINKVKELGNDNDGPNTTVTLQTPSSIYERKANFIFNILQQNNFKKVGNVDKGMNNEDIINLSFLCPLSCSTSYKEAGRLP